LPVVLYGFEIWSLKLRDKYSFRVFENNVLKKISGPKWDEVPTEWRTLHTEEPADLYSSKIYFWLSNWEE
jgi:hypothetical protein